MSDQPNVPLYRGADQKPRGVLNLDTTPPELQIIREPYAGQRLRLTGEQRENGDLEVVRLSKTGVPVEVTYAVGIGPEAEVHALLGAADQFYTAAETTLDGEQITARPPGGYRKRELDRFIAELIYTAGPETVTDALEAALEPDADSSEHNRHITRWAREIADQLTDALP